MSATGLKVFDSTLQTTHVWLDEIMTDLGWDDRHQAYAALRAVLHAIRDRLPVEVAAHFAAQLPLLVRGIYYEGWRPAKPSSGRSRELFLVDIADATPGIKDRTEPQMATAVFKVLSNHLTEGEIEKTRQSLPGDVRKLWSTTVPSGQAD